MPIHVAYITSYVHVVCTLYFPPRESNKTFELNTENNFLVLRSIKFVRCQYHQIKVNFN